MANEIQLKKSAIKKADLANVVNTSFNYFAKPVVTADPDTIQELFRLYRKLYLEIPATGPESHQILVEQSSKIYTPEGMSTADIEPLLAEITDLRKKLLSANEQIQELINAK